MKKSKAERKDGHEQFAQGPWCYAEVEIDGAFHTICKELKEQDSDGFKGYVRMDIDHFEELIHLLSPFLQSKIPTLEDV